MGCGVKPCISSDLMSLNVARAVAKVGSMFPIVSVVPILHLGKLWTKSAQDCSGSSIWSAGQKREKNHLDAAQMVVDLF